MISLILFSILIKELLAIRIINFITPFSPIAEDSYDIVFRADLSANWVSCQWYHNDIPVCGQINKEKNGTFINCFNDSTKSLAQEYEKQFQRQSSFLSGGNSEYKACKLQFNTFDRDDSGEWKVEVLDKYGILDSEVKTVYSSYPPDMTMGDDQIEARVGETLLFDCIGEGGRPEPSQFHWYLSGNEISDASTKYQATFYEFKVDPSYSDEYGYNRVSQTMELNLGQSPEDIYYLKCCSQQINTNYGDKNCAQTKIYYGISLKSSSVSGGWIAFIIIMSIVIVGIIAVLIILWLTGELAILCSKKKNEDKRSSTPIYNIEPQNRIESVVSVDEQSSVTPDIPTRTYINTAFDSNPHETYFDYSVPPPLPPKSEHLRSKSPFCKSSISGLHSIEPSEQFIESSSGDLV